MRHTTIGELDHLPNSYIHELYYQAYKQDLQDEKNPKQAEARAMSRAMENLM